MGGHASLKWLDRLWCAKRLGDAHDWPRNHRTAWFGSRTNASYHLPSMLSLRRDAKRAKLLQYAERVWHISEGTEDARIEAAIQNTRSFFESLNVQTRLSAYDISADAIPAMLSQLESHGMVELGEHKDVTLDKSREVLEASI